MDQERSEEKETKVLQALNLSSGITFRSIREVGGVDVLFLVLALEVKLLMEGNSQ